MPQGPHNPQHEGLKSREPSAAADSGPPQMVPIFCAGDGNILPEDQSRWRDLGDAAQTPAGSRHESPRRHGCWGGDGRPRLLRGARGGGVSVALPRRVLWGTGGHLLPSCSCLPPPPPPPLLASPKFGHHGNRVNHFAASPRGFAKGGGRERSWGRVLGTWGHCLGDSGDASPLRDGASTLCAMGRALCLLPGGGLWAYFPTPLPFAPSFPPSFPRRPFIPSLTLAHPGPGDNFRSFQLCTLLPSSPVQQVLPFLPVPSPPLPFTPPLFGTGCWHLRCCSLARHGSTCVGTAPGCTAGVGGV